VITIHLLLVVRSLRVEVFDLSNALLRSVGNLSERWHGSAAIRRFEDGVSFELFLVDFFKKKKGVCYSTLLVNMTIHGQQ